MLLAALALALLQKDAPPQWILVRSTTEWSGSVTWEQLEQAYLGRVRSRIVDAREVGDYTYANRLMIGRADDNAAVREVAPVLGLEWTKDGLRFQGQTYGPGQGLFIVVDDPDGGGLLSLYTGFDQAGVMAGLSTRTDLARRGYTVVQARRRVGGGDVTLPRELTEPVIVRLDRDFDRLMEETRGWAGSARNLRVARGLAGYGHVFATFTGKADLLPTVSDVLVTNAVDIEVARRFFGGRDLDAEIRRAFELCVEKLGPLEGPNPVYYVLYHRARSTNAKNFGDDGFTKRRQILFNLSALARAEHWRSAVVHETVHAWQKDFGETLAERAVADGVATALTGVFVPDLADADVLLWSPEELAAADARRDAIVAAFRAKADSRDPKDHRPFMMLDIPLVSVEGAPSRTGYYVAWLACKAWLAKHPDAAPRDLLRVPAADVLAALD